MKDFWYHKPTKIIFGHNKVDELGAAIKPFGEKALFVFGQKSIKQHGLYQRIKERLGAAGLQVIEHGGVKSNPVVSHVREGVSLAKKYEVDCVLAVGGGSVIDAAKAIAFGALTSRDVWSFFSEGARPDKALPIFAVVTLAASGSEMNHGVVLTNEETAQKLSIGAPCLVPQVAILDPTLTLMVPRNYTVYGLADTLSHIMEGYFNGENTVVPIQDRLAEGAFLSLLDVSRSLLSDLNNYDYRAEAMWASCIANSGFLNVGRGKIVTEIHCLAHSLGALFDVPHGAAISAAMPAWMTFRLNHKRSKMAQFASRVMGVEDHINEDELAQKGIAELKNWLSSMGSPLSLRDLGVAEDAIPTIVENLEPIASRGGMQDVDRYQLKQVVELMF